jgi:integrase
MYSPPGRSRGEERLRLAEQQKRKNTFAAVAEDFIKEKLPGERKGREVERDIRREFIPAWGRLPITEVTDLQIISVIKVRKQTAPAQARNLLGIAKRLFSWAVDQRAYGLTASPAETLKPTKLIGKKKPRHRILDDDELFALWRTIGRLKYPYGPAYRLLLLTALRLNEVADASWSEFDLEKKIWIIPAGRMKGDNDEARSHAVPLTADIMAVLKELPRFRRGKYCSRQPSARSRFGCRIRLRKKLMPECYARCEHLRAGAARMPWNSSRG